MIFSNSLRKFHSIMYLLLIYFLTGNCNMLCAQVLSGKIIYTHTNNWPKIAAQLPYLTLEEKDRIILTWGKNLGYSEKMIFTFNDSVSHYTYEIDDKSEESNWSYKKSDYQIYRNFIEQTFYNRIGMLGKTYIVTDKCQDYIWKIRGEIKDVAGYVCMKAETFDSVKNQHIVAWFTDKILISSGPEEFGGLPGLILEININDNSASIIAESILLNTPQEIKKPKSKGKFISYNEYRKIITSYITDCIERRRNPFWDLRY